MEQISFYINKDIINDLSNYNIEEINAIAKNLFLEWHKKTFYTNLSGLDNTLELHQQKIRSDIDDKISNIKSSITDLCQVTKDVFGISKTSQKRGEIMENSIYELFQNQFQNYSFEKTNHLSHHADATMITPDNHKFLIEIKNYQNTVDQKEIDKLKYDMSFTKIKHGLFISIQSGIVGKKVVDIERYTRDDNEYSIVYISYVLEENHKIHTGIAMIEALMKLDTCKKTNRIEYLEDRVLKTMREISYLSDTLNILRTKFIGMEKVIKDQLNDYYVNIRDYECQIKNKLNIIWDNIMKDIANTGDILLEYDDNDIILDETKDTEVFSIMSKLLDILKDKNYKLIRKSETNLSLYNKDKYMGDIKKFRQKIEVTFEEPKITIKFNVKDNNDINYKFLESIISYNKT